MATFTITFDPNLFTVGGTDPTPLTVSARPFRPAGWPILLDPDSFGVKNEVTKRITPSDPTLVLEETSPDWCWKFEVRHRSVDSQWVKYAYLTADVNFLDMPSLDPDTFLPGPDPDPAWIAALAAEVAAREAGDQNLQDQIDAIEASDVETVAGVGPDVGGDVPAADLKTALNLPDDTDQELTDQADALASEATARENADTDILQLVQWARNPDQLIVGAVARNANGAATSAPVVWPDGTPGTYTADTLSTAFPGAVDAYHVTYGSPATRTYTQPAVTRDAGGAVTDLPAIVVT